VSVFAYQSTRSLYQGLEKPGFFKSQTHWVFRAFYWVLGFEGRGVLDLPLKYMVTLHMSRHDDAAKIDPKVNLKTVSQVTLAKDNR